MIANTLSPCIATEKVEESRDFYVKHFEARVTFDCGWYVNMQIGKKTSELQFMTPRQPGPPACNPAGLMYNFSVDDGRHAKKIVFRRRRRGHGDLPLAG
jgi:catechol 2,3-dioxygenase-like lactoylglutathione lyase family enzyme